MGYTITAQGEDVYILDYDAIRTGRKSYFRYDITGSTISAPTNVEISHSYHIDGNSYAENGSSITLSELFNQCVVVDEFSDIDSLFDGLDKQRNYSNITSTSDILTDTSQYRESLQAMVKNANNELEPILVMIKRVTPEARLSGGANNRGDFRYYLVIAKFYNNPLINVKRYSNNASHTVVSNDTFNPEKYSQLS
jgi:hypothetical protein|nr:MAG TPA: hypothetical protein [Caudoviricetes sp.]